MCYILKKIKMKCYIRPTNERRAPHMREHYTIPHDITLSLIKCKSGPISLLTGQIFDNTIQY